MQMTCLGPCSGPSSGLTCIGGDYTVCFYNQRWLITTSKISKF